MPWHLPFHQRVLLAIGFLALASTIELALRGRQAVRWRASLIIVAGGLAGAVLGVSVDSITSRLSPEYFVHGKGLAPGPGFESRVLTLGSQAGVSVGVLLGCVLLVAGRGRPYWKVLCSFRWVLAGGALGSLLQGLVGAFLLSTARLDRHGFPLGNEAQRRAFLTVWNAHGGVYVGALIGTAVAAWALRRLPRLALDNSAAEAQD